MSDRYLIASDSTEISPRSSTSVAPAAIAALVNSIMLASAATAQGSEPAMLLAAADTVTLDKLTVEGSKEKPLSSPKFTTALVDTPQTVVVVPSEVYLQQGAATLTDVLRNTPGITFLAGEGGNASTADGDSFFLRGFDASNSLFADGVRDSGQYSRDVFNVEQVEIAKGPAGADVGRTTAGGYVNLATKSPRAESFQHATVSYGSEDRKRATIDINEPLQGTAAFRLNALWQEGGVAGRDTVEENRVAVAPSFALGLGTPTRVVLAYEHFNYDDLPDYGLPRAAMSDGGGFTPRPASVDQETFYGAQKDFDDITRNSLLARVEHDVSTSLRVSNQTKLTRIDRLALLTAPTGYTAATGLVTRTRQGNERENETVSNLTNLTAAFATGSLEHSLSAGFEYLWEKQNVFGYAATQGTNPALATYDPRLPTPLANPATGGDFLDPVRSGASTYGGIETLALYTFDTVKLSPQWEITGGIRLEKYEADYRSTAVTGVATRLAADDEIFSGKLGVVFKPAANGSLYAAVATSVRPPGANFTATSTGTGADNLSADPHEATNLELGTKWEFFQNRLSTTLAVFQSKNENISVATDSVTGLPIQTGEQTVQGIEAGISGRVSENWLVFGGFSLLDSENSNPTAGAANNNAAIQWTPRLSGNVWTTYRLPFGLTLGGGAQYMDQVARQTTSNPAAVLAHTPDYWLVNAVASYPVSENVVLRLNVNNVFDEFYLQSLNNNANRYNPGAPRNFVLSAEFQF